MYRVYAFDQKEYFPLYEPLEEGLRVFSPILTQEMGTSGYFEFKIFSSHPYYKKIGILKTEIVVYDGEKEIFWGRILKPETNIDNIISITCEGELSYLIDSRQRPYEVEGSIAEFVDWALEIHNSQVDDFKKIYPGNIVVSTENAYTVRSDPSCSTTLETLKKQLTEAYGGYLRIRHEGGKKYLDYLWDYGGTNEQTIRFGENLLELNHCIDASELITCLIPFGAEADTTDSDGKKQTQKLTVASVNNGLDYIQNDASIELYGKIWGSYTWKDITDPEELLKKAREYLDDMSALSSSIEVTAIDLAQIDTKAEAFELGCWTKVISEPHGIEKEYILTKRIINLLDPTQGSISLGKTEKTFTESVTKGQQESLQKVEDMNETLGKEFAERLENATQLITGGLGGYVVIDCEDPETGETIQPWRILIMNTPDKKTAKNVIQLNQNGIGFSNNGINGPYKNAWTIDGNLTADFILTGTMLADRIRGGILELGGTGIGKDGVILIKNESGKVVGRFDKNGITIIEGTINITAGSIDLGGFKVTSGGVMTLDGTSNSSSVGADLVNCNTLRVAGSIQASGATFNIGGMFSTGSYVHGSFMGDFTGSFYETSDARLKSEIKDITPELARDIVARLRPVYFVIDGEMRMGFVAQEVEELRRELKVEFPLTSVDKENGYYRIPYGTYVALLAGAVQAIEAERRR